LVFTGYDGGISDLFVVNADGSGLHRLTNDKYADLQPSWAPDGKTIAFATDRGGKTDFDGLTFGNMRIALFHLDNGKIDLLGHMDQGKNIDPAWAPDGKSLAFVSDRSGISNVFLYDLSDANIYQLTDMYTGVSGITPYSPCLSWAHEADRLAFAYYEEDEYNVYAVDNPRSLKRKPYQAPAVPPVTSLLAAERRALGGPTPVAAAAVLLPVNASPREPRRPERQHPHPHAADRTLRHQGRVRARLLSVQSLYSRGDGRAFLEHHSGRPPTGLHPRPVREFRADR